MNTIFLFPIHHIAFFSAIFLLFYLYLTFCVLQLRLKYRVSLSDNEHEDLAIAIRVHANFMEYVPFLLFVLFLVEYQTQYHVWVGVLATTLFAGRVFHVIGMRYAEKKLWCRRVGMVATLLVMAASALTLLIALIF